MTILIINLIREENSLHENEFLNPIIDIIEKTKIDFKIIHYLKLNEISIENYEKIILSGTSLKDNEYLNHIDKFQKLKEYKNFILAICAGAQIIAKIHNAKIKKGKEIGLMETILVKENQILNLVAINQIYTLHNYYFETPKNFEIILKTKYPQLIQYNKIYLCLFHPEVRNKQLILNFLKL